MSSLKMRKSGANASVLTAGLAAALLLPASFACASQVDLAGASFEFTNSQDTGTPTATGVYTAVHSLGTESADFELIPAPSVRGDVINQGSMVATLSYFFEVLGPDSQLVPLTLAGRYELSIHNVPPDRGGADAQADVQVYDQSGRVAFAGDSISGSRFDKTDKLVESDFLLPFSVATGIANRVDLNVTADIFSPGGATPTYFSDAYIDPVISIDQAFLDANPGYSLRFSAGVGNSPAASAAPEPATWGLMIGGFGLASAALRRRAPVAA